MFVKLDARWFCLMNRGCISFNYSGLNNSIHPNLIIIAVPLLAAYRDQSTTLIRMHLIGFRMDRDRRYWRPPRLQSRAPFDFAPNRYNGLLIIRSILRARSAPAAGSQFRLGIL